MHRRFIRIDSIAFIAASGDYSEVHLNDKQHGLTGKSMKEWEDILPQENFCRIHRSTIINLNNVKEWQFNSMLVYLKNTPEPFAISRRCASEIKKILF